MPVTHRWLLVLAVLALGLGIGSAQVEAQDPNAIEAKMKQVQELVPRWIQAGGNPGEIAPLREKLDKYLKARDLAGADETLDRILSIVKSPRAPARGAGLGRVRVRVYDAKGRPVAKAQLTPRGYDTVVTGVYALDVTYQPVPAVVTAPQDGLVILADPVPTPLVLHFFPHVPGFGQVKVYADNGGKGYAAPASGAWEIDLPLEAARSRIAKTRELARGPAAGAMRQETRDRLASAEQHLRAATRGDAVDAGEVYQALNDALWAGEMAAIDAARREIAARGRRPGFRFGIFTEGWENWKPQQRTQVRAVFNFATVLDFFLRSFEDERGQPRPEAAERAVTLAEQLGLEVKGHPLIYLIPPNVPRRLQGKSFDLIVDAMRTRVMREVRRFRGRVKIWDVINEPNFSNAPYSQEQFAALSRMAMAWVKEADPAAVRVVNVNWPTGEYVVFPPFRQVAPKAADGSIAPTLQLLRAYAAGGVDYDVIGIEMYYPALDMMELSRLLDRYAALGKPIHITEVGVASAPDVDRRSQYFQNREFIAALGTWHGPWSERLQADWVEQFYTIAYSKPRVEAISWTHVVDSFWPFGGLFRRDGTPKESYTRLKTLLESWGFSGAARSPDRDRRQ